MRYPFYTTKDAAIKLGMSYAAIYKYVERYGLGTKVGFGRDLFLTDDDLAFIKTRKGQVGRPKGQVGRPSRARRSLSGKGVTNE